MPKRKLSSVPHTLSVLPSGRALQPCLDVLIPLAEGALIGGPSSAAASSTDSAAPSTIQGNSRVLYSETKPYSRGSRSVALGLARDPASRNACKQELEQSAFAANAVDPRESRKETWHAIATEAGFEHPFDLTPDLIATVVGILKRAGYRSAEQYLEVAWQEFLEDSEPSSALWQAKKRAIRAAKRGRGPAKQAQALPLQGLSSLTRPEPVMASAPCHPGRATLCASWWLTREIEAASAKIKHVSISPERLVSWTLPNSKTDLQALGSTRSHACSCRDAQDPICPACNLIAQVEWVKSSFPELEGNAPLFPTREGGVPSKQGFADSFQWCASSLSLPTQGPTGVRLFTGHSARASGAQHLAKLNVELWRIQLFGRWGSEAFLRYVREAPIANLSHLAQETSLQASLAKARAELAAIVTSIQGLRDSSAELPPNAIVQATEVLPLTLSDLTDGEAAQEIVPLPLPPAPASHVYVTNEDSSCTHIARVHGALVHPSQWRTHCGWRFGRTTARTSICESKPDIVVRCDKCWASTFEIDALSESS